MLTIIAGKHRGKKIDTRDNGNIRPTGSRARGAIFNILLHGQFSGEEHSPLIDKNVVDLFCGTGALGLEALSRGAARVTFVDGAKASLAIARANAAHIRETEHSDFVLSDSTLLPPARKTHSLAFIDPPYHSGLAVKSLISLDKQGWLEPEAVIVVELAKNETLAAPAHYTLFDERHYGNTTINFLRYQP